MMRILNTVPYTLKRLSKDYIALLLLLILPIALISVLAISFGDSVDKNGTPLIQSIAITMVLSFQLFGGGLVMNLIHVDLFKERRYRMQTLPIDHSLYGFSITVVGTLFSFILGVILMGYSSFVFDVNWGNLLWVTFVIGLIATLSSIVCLIFTFTMKNFSVAERLTDVYGIGSILLLIAGMFLPMPDYAVIEWINDFVNPLSITQSAILDHKAGDMQNAWLNVAILAGWIIGTFLVMLPLGRRRMP